MKKFLSLVALSLATLCVNAQMSDYTFVASEWPAGDPGRISGENVSVNETDNTITVSQTGTNNAALIFRSENSYQVTASQRYFVIKATGLSTAEGDSYLWWLNNTNNGSQIPPTDIYEEDGKTVFAWDCATISIGGTLGQNDTEFKDGGGWSTTFGMTLADEAVPAVISYIGFEEAIANPVEEFEYEFVAAEWPAGDPGRISASNVVVDEVNNTITVDATGDNNVALNFKTDKVYFITKPVKYFVIQGTGLSTEDGKSYLWWLNAKNNGAQVKPTDVAVKDGVVSLIWDVTTDATFASGFNAEGKSYLDGTGAGSWGWTTTFGLTLADESVPAVISYIGYEGDDSELVKDLTSTVPVAVDGYATFSCNKSLDFTGSPIAAYAATEIVGSDESGRDVKFKRVYQVEAGTGVLLHATTATTEEVAVLDGVLTETYSNIFKVAETDMTDTDLAGGYILADGAEGMGFYRAGAGATLAKGKAYLPSSVAGARIILPGNEATAIETVGAAVNGRADVYNLQGQRMLKAQKGLNIVRSADGRQGKKFMVR